jgi:hypothetical protein
VVHTSAQRQRVHEYKRGEQAGTKEQKKGRKKQKNKGQPQEENKSKDRGSSTLPAPHRKHTSRLLALPQVTLSHSSSRQLKPGWHGGGVRVRCAGNKKKKRKKEEKKKKGEEGRGEP